MTRWGSAAALLAATGALGAAIVSSASPAPSGARAERVEKINLQGTVNLGELAAGPRTGRPSVRHFSIKPRASSTSRTRTAAALPQLTLGGRNAPSSPVVAGGDTTSFRAIDIIDMESGGTGNYANSNGGLEPPDQGLCAGAGYVIEAVNDSLRVYTAAGAKLTPASVPLSQFFALAPFALNQSDFISDPRCYFDPTTQRWFVVVLDLNYQAYPVFTADRNFIAVSKTSNPMGSWNIYNFDVTDNGVASPLHPGCVAQGCLGDQPVLGMDQNGVYVTDNEYALAEVFPVAPPVFPPLQQIPVLRSGVSQFYALSKQQLESGTSTTLVRFDTNTIPFPGPAEDSPWQSVQPANPTAGDTTAEPAGGVEYFVSDVGLPANNPSNQIEVWAWTNTSSLSGSSPNLTLLETTVRAVNADDTFYAPDPAAPSSTPFPAYQKDGPHPKSSAAGDPEEYLNANDDRMQAPVLSAGNLWSGLNTWLPPTTAGATGHLGENRVGIMYFEVTPVISGGTLKATMARDGYVHVARNNVLFPSIGARPDGATVMTFTLSGLDHFPSLAWARLDGFSPNLPPTVHVSLEGAAPEDGFTGLGTAGQQGGPDVPPCGPCIARWGDYSASEVDGQGCIWGAAEYIATTKQDTKGAGNWGTGIHQVCPEAIAAAATPPATVVAPIQLPPTSSSPPWAAALAGLLAAIAALLLLAPRLGRLTD